MTRVAFWYDYGVVYSGGLNYFRNLLYALSQIKDKNIEPYVFFGTGVDKKIIEEFNQYATVIQTSILERKTIPWLIHRVLFRLFGSQFMVNRTLKKHDISVVSHASMVYGTKRSYRLITWIADFQYLHLPELFPGLKVAEKTKSLNNLICNSDIVVMSSYDALNDFNKIVRPEFASRGRVLQFVSQPNDSSHTNDQLADRAYLNNKYGFSGQYFFLPNQFWKHKNHEIIFEAVKLLKEKGKEILIICTGWLCDPRYKKSEYVSSLLNFIDNNNLQTNIKLLGSIDYVDVLSLLRGSIAVLNPSRFEGWSSSVEEAKSVGKQVILSNINVHIEQNPPGGKYFDPDDIIGLSRILEDAWDTWQDTVNPAIELEASEKLHARTIDFGKKYLDIIDELEIQMR